MRALLTLLTIGAAGASYAYLQHPSALGEPYASKPVTAKPLDWNLFGNSPTRDSHVPIKELVSRIHERTRTALDEFADRHLGHSDAPGDDAFQRLRQVTQSAVLAVSNSTNAASDFERNGAARVPQPNFDELQRTAFDVESNLEKRPVPSEVKVGQQAVPQQVSDSKQAEPPRQDRPNEIAQTPSAEQSKPTMETAAAATSTATQTSVRRTADPQGTVSTEKPRTPVIKRVSDRATKLVDAKWKVVGKTTEGRPMHTMHFGDRGVRTLVIAGLNGDDPTAVRWLELLTEEIRRKSDLLDNNEIVFFRAGNPDGLVRKSRNNLRGVPLNRNFPSRRFRNSPDLPRSAAPASEVETRVILETLYSFRPRRVIHLMATTGRTQVLYNRSAKEIAGQFELASKLPVRLFDTEQFPGSIEDFTDGTLEAAVLSMRLSMEQDWQKAWDKVQPYVLQVVTGKSSDPPSEADKKSSTEEDPDRTELPPILDDPPRSNPHRRGYEELPPLPKVDSAHKSSGK